MESKRTFRDGSVSFKEPCVTNIWYYEAVKEKSWAASVLDQMRFQNHIEKTKTVLLPVLESKIKHFKICKLKDHYECGFI